MAIALTFQDAGIRGDGKRFYRAAIDAPLVIAFGASNETDLLRKLDAAASGFTMPGMVPNYVRISGKWTSTLTTGAAFGMLRTYYPDGTAISATGVNFASSFAAAGLAAGTLDAYASINKAKSFAYDFINNTNVLDARYANYTPFPWRDVALYLTNTSIAGALTFTQLTLEVGEE